MRISLLPLQLKDFPELRIARPFDRDINWLLAKRALVVASLDERVDNSSSSVYPADVLFETLIEFDRLGVCATK